MLDNPCKNPDGARIAVAAVAASAIAVTTCIGPHYDEVDLSKVPILGSFFPEEPKVSKGGKFQSLYSQVFQFSVSLPEPFGLEHKEIANIWNTIVTHKERDGAYSIAFATLPQSVQQTQPALTMLPFSQVAATYPVTRGIDVEKSLDSSAQSSVDFIHGTITHKAAIRLNNFYPGREVDGKLPNIAGLFRRSLYIANGNFYRQIVVGIPSWTNSADADKFLDSFKLGP